MGPLFKNTFFLVVIGWSLNTEFHLSAAVVRGQYYYMDDLLELQACKPQVSSKTPTEGGKIRSPLYDRREAWASLLGGHPDRLFYYYICSGLVHGFRIGFGYGSHTCRSGKGNMQSVLEHPEVVSGYLQREVSLGRVKGPLGPEAASLSQVSPFGVIPKSAPGQWRLILDLSHPAQRAGV